MIDDQIEKALKSTAPVNELRKLAENLLSAGRKREALIDLFEQARQQLRRSGREADEDAVTDVLDFLVGWCSPHMKLPPEQPSTNLRS